MMSKLLQQIANTIVANLSNTEPIGLFHGKIGICLFLYKYARFSGNKVYEEISSSLLDDVFEQLKPNLSPSVVNGLAGIGYSLAILLRECFLESDSGDDVLYDIDDLLLSDTKISLLKEVHFPIPLYSSGIYLLSRFPLYQDVNRKQWDDVICDVIEFIKQRTQKGYFLKLSLLNSLLFIFSEIYTLIESDKNKINSLLKEVLRLSMLCIRQKAYGEIDVWLLRQNLEKLPIDVKELSSEIIKELNQFEDLSDDISMESWFDNLWWNILYKIPIPFFSDEIIDFVEENMKNSFYDDTTINSKLAGIGLLLMSENVMK